MSNIIIILITIDVVKVYLGLKGFYFYISL